MLTFAEQDGNVVGGQLALALDTDEKRGTTACAGKFAREVDTLKEE